MRSFFFRFISLIVRYNKYLKASGIIKGTWYTMLEICGSRKQVLIIYKEKNFRFRLNTSDIDVFHSVFVKEEYAIEIESEPKIIIDAGAYTGFSSVFFAEKYPLSVVYSIEPENENYELLLENSKGFKNIIAINKALWFKDEKMKLYERKTGKWGNSLMKSNDTIKELKNVDAISMVSIMKDFSLERIDFLKIDIEGAEKQIFENADLWIDKVEMIAIELHDRIQSGCSRVFYKATSDFEFELHKEETVIVSKKKLLN